MAHDDHPGSAKVEETSSGGDQPDATPPVTGQVGQLSPDVGQILADSDEERPGRRLSGPVALAITVVCGLVSVFVLWTVFFPLAKGTQYYLTIFLAAVLPLTFLCYRSGFGVRRTDAGSGRDNPGVVDWALAAVSVVVALYPLLAYDSFLERRQIPTTLDLVAGLVLMLLIL
jgi:TRAP-type uncharacterized transport system fused permease subunit